MDKSDSLFAQGVELYHQNKYNEAIPLFTESDKIDQAVLDSTSNRLLYSAMWLASCYYRIGDSVTASKISKYYQYEPVDRRLTVTSDSLAARASHIFYTTNNTDQPLTLLQEASAIEAEQLGETHWYRAMTIANILSMQIQSQHIQESRNTLNELYHIATLNTHLYLPDKLLWYSFMTLIQEEHASMKDHYSMIDQMIHITSASKAMEGNNLWSSLLSFKANSLYNENKHDEAYRLLGQACADMKAEGVINENLFEVLSQLGTSMTQKFIQSKNQSERETLLQQRMDIYQKMLNVAECLWGKTSLKYGQVLLKMANTHLGMGLSLDRKKGKEMLIQAFELIADSANVVSEPFEAVSTMESAINSFDVADANDLFIAYAQKIADIVQLHYPQLISLSALKERIADCYGYTDGPDGKRKAIAIYTELINDHTDKPNALSKYLQKRGFQYEQIKEYQKSLSDYLLVDSIANTMPTQNFMEEWDKITPKKDVAELYLQVGDTTNYTKYNDLYCNKAENLIERIINNEVQAPDMFPYVDDAKLDIIKTYADYFTDLRNITQHIHKAIHYYKLCLDYLPKANLLIETPEEFSYSTYSILSQLYIRLYDFDNGYACITQMMDNARKCQNFSGYIRALDNLSSLYEHVSVEPELSLKYKVQACEMLSENLLNNRDAMLKEEYKIGYDLMLHEWDTCIDLNNYLGDEQEADRCYRQKFHYMELLEGKENIAYATERFKWLSHKISFYCFTQQDDGQAHAYCDSLAAFYERNRHFFTDSGLHNYKDIGDSYYYCNDTLNALRYLDLYEQELKAQYPDNYEERIEYLNLMKDKATYFQSSQESLTALQAIEPLYSKVKDKYPSQYSSFLHRLISKAEEVGNREMVVTYSRKLLAHSPDENTVKINLAKIYQEQKEYDKLLAMFDDMSQNTRRQLLELFTSSPAEHRESLWQSCADIPFNTGEPLAEMFGEQVSATTLYDNLLMRKSLLLDVSISSENLIRTEGDSLLLAKYDRMLKLKQQLDNSDKDSLEDNGRILSREQATKIVRRFNQEIMDRASMLGDNTASLAADWKTVQQNLGENEVAVEFSKYTSFGGEVSYAAVVLPQQGKPIFRFLCREADIRRIPQADFYTSTDTYKQIWKPLEDCLTGKKTVYFSPDGILYNLALENVRMPGSDTLISNRYDIRRLSTTRQLISAKKKDSLNMAAVYGGLRFNADATTLLHDSKKYPVNRSFSYEPFSIADSLNLRNGVDYLPATKQEALEINNQLKHIHVNVELFTDTIGTEASFKNLSGQQVGLLHIATHGFYWTETEAQHLTHLSFLSLPKEGQTTPYAEDKALTRSGLLLAGANNALMGKPLPEHVDDGILTAKEISVLDLRGLDLVVLSACQTGLGEVTGDGVFGLQRGFKKAGAKSLLMSLWKVDDAATQLLMTRFYANLTAGKSKSESLREAQEYVREYEMEVEKKVYDNRRTRPLTARERAQAQKDAKVVKQTVRPYQNPRYWAAFILLDAVD